MRNASNEAAPMQCHIWTDSCQMESPIPCTLMTRILQKHGYMTVLL